MVKYSCETCQKVFSQKGHYEKHLQRTRPCKKDNTIEVLVEQKVKEILSRTQNNQQDNSAIISEDIGKYLKSIRTNQGYKRVSLSPLRYAGGKSKAVGLILSYFPKLKERKIVSPFFGGGSFEIALSKELGFHVIGYDIFNILVNFWNQVTKFPSKLADELEKLIPTKEEYTKNRHILLSYWEKVKPNDLKYTTKNKLLLTNEQQTMLDKDAILQAAYYYYNMQLSYGPMFLGWPSSVYLKQDRYKTIIQNIRDFNPNPGNLEVHCASFEDVIVKHDKDFLFLDPPYYLGDDSKMFKGMYPNCNFAIHHNNFNHELLRNLLKKHKGGFFVTYNDCPTIREWYKDFKQEYPKWQYTYGQGETRIGRNRESEGSNVKESHEIFIICPPLCDMESSA